MGQNICGVVSKSDNEPISNMQEVSELDFNRNSTYKRLEQYATTVCKEKQVSGVYNNLIQRLLSMGQFHLLEQLKTFQNIEQRHQYLSGLESINYEMEVIDSLYHHFMQQTQDNITLDSETKEQLSMNVLKPISDVLSIEDVPYDQFCNLYRQGLNLIANKQVALVVMAGGRNVRFGLGEVKSCYDIGLPSGLCIQQLIGKRLQTLKEIAFSGIPASQSHSFQIVILTNYTNHLRIEKIWKTNDYFGFDEQDITFIHQGMYPITDMRGKLLLKQDQPQCHVFPCGTGDSILKLIQNKIIAKLTEKKYKFIHFIGAEDLLVKPLDPLFLGYACENRKSINQKCVDIIDPFDLELYRLASVNGRATLLEYEDLRLLLQAQKSQGSDFSSTFCGEALPERQIDTPGFINSTLVSLDFLTWFQRRGDVKFAFEAKFRAMKRHLTNVREITPTEDATQTQPNMVDNFQDQNNVLMFEKLLGDLLEQTDEVAFLKINEQDEFAPIIYKTGKYSSQDAIQKLSNLHKKWMHMTPQESRETGIIEVCPSVSYGGENLDSFKDYINQNQKIQTYPLLINKKKNSNDEVDQVVDNSQYHSFDGNTNNNNFNNPITGQQLTMEAARQSFVQDTNNESLNNQKKQTDNLRNSLSNIPQQQTLSASQRQININQKSKEDIQLETQHNVSSFDFSKTSEQKVIQPTNSFTIPKSNKSQHELNTKSTLSQNNNDQRTLLANRRI